MTAIAIDPNTQDYDTSNGALVRDASGGLMNAIELRILVPLGSYWFDPNLGSKLFLLKRAKDLSNISQLAEQYALQALQGLLDDGRASAINITTEQPGNGWLYMWINVTAATGQIITFSNSIQVSGS